MPLKTCIFLTVLWPVYRVVMSSCQRRLLSVCSWTNGSYDLIEFLFRHLCLTCWIICLIFLRSRNSVCLTGNVFLLILGKFLFLFALQLFPAPLCPSPSFPVNQFDSSLSLCNPSRVLSAMSALSCLLSVTVSSWNACPSLTFSHSVCPATERSSCVSYEAAPSSVDSRSFSEVISSSSSAKRWLFLRRSHPLLTCRKK